MSATDALGSQWEKSQLAGSYVSSCGRYSAELRPAGNYPQEGGKLVRHYAIRQRGHQAIVGTARTLSEAKRMYL